VAADGTGTMTLRTGYDRVSGPSSRSGQGHDQAGAGVVLTYCDIENAKSIGYAWKPVAWTGRLMTVLVTRGPSGFPGRADQGRTPKGRTKR
jgi:hypothetical protein